MQGEGTSRVSLRRTRRSCRVPDEKLRLIIHVHSDSHPPLRLLLPQDVPATDLFPGKKVVICGVPGAFTPTCSDSHLPSFIALADKFKARESTHNRFHQD